MVVSRPVRDRFLSYLPSALLLLFGIICYANSFAVPLQFDDDIVARISTDFSVELFSGTGFMRKARWLVDATFALNRMVHGEEPFGFHLVNLVIHLLTTLTLYQLISCVVAQLLGETTAEDPPDVVMVRRMVPFFSAALFVCHPLQTQAITYIAQRYTVLVALFYIGTLFSYLRWRTDEGIQRVAWGTAAVGSALLAMKCKETAATLPIMVLLCEVVLFDGRLLKKWWFLLVCLVLALVVPLQVIVIRSWYSGDVAAGVLSASRETVDISRVDYLLTQCAVVASYLRLLLLPVGQNVDHDYPVYHDLATWPVAGGMLLHFIMCGTAGVLVWRVRRGAITGVAAICSRLISFGICWFYLALVVESSLIPIRDVMFEHRVYLPSAGFFLALLALAAWLAYARRTVRVPLDAVLLLLVTVLAITTIARNRIWNDKMALWQDAVAKSPGKARPHHTLGFMYVKRNQPERALPHLVRALEIDPGLDRYWATLNSALLLMEKYQGRGSSGVEYLAAIGEVNPLYLKQWAAVSYNNLGLAYEFLGNLYRAEQSYQQALELNPGLALAWYNLALTLAARSEGEASMRALQRLATLNQQLARDAGRLVPGLLRSGAPEKH